jgi:uncharacterized membrane protein
MLNLYSWLKFIHVASIAVWFGGFAALGFVNIVTSRKPDPAEVSTYLRYGEGLGASLAGPASGLALIAGIAAMVVGHVGMQLWIIWGLVVAGLFILVGVLGMRPVLLRLRAARDAHAGPEELLRLLKRQRLLLLVNLMLLLSAIWAMTFKP